MMLEYENLKQESAPDLDSIKFNQEIYVHRGRETFSSRRQ